MGKKKRSSSGKSQDTKTEQEKSWLIMNQVKPPEPFNFQESASWNTWIKRYKMFHCAVGLSSAGEDQQINMLLYCMGQEAEDLLSSLGMTEDKRTSFKSVVAEFEDYFTMKKYTLYNRALFMERNQRPGEKLDSYIDDLSKLSEKCEWTCKNCKSTDFGEEMILIKLIAGITDKSLSKRLQRQEITTLREGVKVLREAEVGGQRVNDTDASKDCTTMRPGTQVEDLRPLKSVNNANVKPASYIAAGVQHRECAPPTFTSREEKANMRSSFSSGVDTGDEYATDEQSGNCYFYISGESQNRFNNAAVNFEWKASSASITSSCEDQRPIKQCGCRVANCSHGTIKEDSFSTINRKFVTAGKRASVQNRLWSIESPDDNFDSDEEYEFLEYLRDFNQKNYLAYISDKTCSSVKTPYQLDNVSWPELEKTVPKVDGKPKPDENYHFSVSGHTSRKSLRKMCQQTLKNSY